MSQAGRGTKSDAAEFSRGWTDAPVAMTLEIVYSAAASGLQIISHALRDTELHT